MAEFSRGWGLLPGRQRGLSHGRSHNSNYFAYTALGDLATSYPGGPNSPTNHLTTYTYDPASHLASITADGTTTSFTIDALGRHATQTIGADPTTTYGYIGTSQSVVSLTNNGTTTLSGVDSIGDRITTDLAGNTAYVVADLHGNVVATVSTGSTPVFLTAYRFDAYGQTCDTYVAGGTTDTNRWRFQGRMLESKSGSTDLYDFGARSYDPSLGTFTSFDSVAGGAQNPVTLNRYLYAGGNPVTLVDPNGHCWGICIDINPVGALQSATGAATGAVSTFVKDPGGTIANTAYNVVETPLTVATTAVDNLDNAIDTGGAIFQSAVYSNLPGPVQGVWSAATSGPAFGVGFVRGGLDGIRDIREEFKNQTLSTLQCMGDAGCRGQQLDNLQNIDVGKSGGDMFGGLWSAGGQAWSDFSTKIESGDFHGAGVDAGHDAVAALQIATVVYGGVGILKGAKSLLTKFSNLLKGSGGLSRDAALSAAIQDAQTVAADARRLTAEAGVKPPSATSSWVSMATGRTYRGLSGILQKLEDVPEPLRSLLAKNEAGVRTWTPWNCAEVMACSAAIRAGERLEDLVGATVRTSNGRPMVPCIWCETWIRKTGVGRH